jgi:hypothetical protein
MRVSFSASPREIVRRSADDLWPRRPGLWRGVTVSSHHRTNSAWSSSNHAMSCQRLAVASVSRASATALEKDGSCWTIFFPRPGPCPRAARKPPDDDDRAAVASRSEPARLARLRYLGVTNRARHARQHGRTRAIAERYRRSSTCLTGMRPMPAHPPIHRRTGGRHAARPAMHQYRAAGGPSRKCGNCGYCGYSQSHAPEM